MFSAEDQHWMQHALSLAEKAEAQGEVPVGAVLVLDGKLIGEGYNQPISQHDPTAHAEIIALRAGAKTITNYRLVNTKLYVTLEPCHMCVGAMIHARIAELIFGASDSKAGATNHCVNHRGGLLADACGEILTNFFRQKRAG